MAWPAQLEARPAVPINIAGCIWDACGSLNAVPFVSVRVDLSFVGTSVTSECDDLAIFDLDATNAHAGFHHAFDGPGDVTLLEGLGAAGHQPIALSDCSLCRFAHPSGSRAHSSISVLRQATLRAPILTRFGKSPRFSSRDRVRSQTREISLTSSWRKNGDSIIGHL